MLHVLAIGFLFGFFGSVPTSGPGSVLVFARATERRWRGALFLGLGCAVAEAVYAGLVFVGFSTFLDDHPLLVPISSGVGALTLWAVGIYTLFRRGGGAQGEQHDRPGGSFVAGLVITALNPALIATWAAASAVAFSTGLVQAQTLLALPFGLAAGAGVIAWYALLVALVRRHRDRFRTQTLDRVVRIMGGVLIGVGVWLAWRFAAALAA